MADHAVTLVVAAFGTSDAATTAFKQLKDGSGVKIQDVALAEKQTDGTLKIHDAKDWGWGKGALVGGLAGLIVGVIVPPAGVILGLLGGAGIGALGSGLHDAGVSTDTIKAVAATLEAGSAALILAVDPGDAKAAEEYLAAAGATTVSEGLSGDQLAALKENQGPTAYDKSMIERGAVDTSRFQ